MELENTVVLDDATKQLIADHVRIMNEAQSRVQLLIQVYLNAKGLSGIWDLSQDGATLVKRV